MDLKAFLKRLGVTVSDDDDAQSVAERAERLEAAFGGDDEFLAEQLRAGHDVPEAVQALRAGYDEQIDRLQAANTVLQAERDEAQTKTSELQAELETTRGKVTQLQTALDDAEQRPPVAPGAADPESDGDGQAGQSGDEIDPEALTAKWKASEELQQTFGTAASFIAYTRAAKQGRIRSYR